MAFELERESMRIYEPLKATNSKIILNTDIIIPDTKPDIMNILDVGALTSVDEKDIHKNKITVSGNVYFTILYSGGEETPEIKSIYYTSPFKEELNVEGMEENCDNFVLAGISHIEPVIVNSRKLNIKTVVDFEVCAVSEKTVAAVSSVSADCSVPSKKEKHNILDLSVCTQSSFMVTDELKVSSGNGVDEILKTDIKLVSKELKPMNNKLVIKGSILTDTLYTSEGELYHTENETPFTEVVDAEGLTAEMNAEVKYAIHNFESEVVRAENEEIITFESKIDVALKAYEESSYEIISDIYSPDYEVETSRDTYRIRIITDSFKEKFTISEVVSLEKDKPDILKVFSFGALPHVDTITPSEGYAMIDGYINAKIMYLTDSKEMPLCSSDKKIPFSLRINNKKISSDSVLDIEVKSEHDSYILKSEKDFEVRASLGVEGKIISQNHIDIISDIEIREDTPLFKENQPGIVIYFADKDECLWNIAKRYNTTVKEIAELNGIEENSSLSYRQQLIIPKHIVI